MKVWKIFVALFIISIVTGIIWWKTENHKEIKKVSTVKKESEWKVENEESTITVEKDNIVEEKKEVIESDFTEQQEQIENIENNNNIQSSNNHNQSNNENNNQLADNRNIQQSNVIESTNNYQAPQIKNDNNEKKQDQQVQENNEEKEHNQKNVPASSEKPTIIYTIENDVVADPRLRIDKKTLDECLIYGQTIVEQHEEECERGCSVICQDVMGKYTREIIGYMLIIRKMDGYGTILSY